MENTSEEIEGLNELTRVVIFTPNFRVEGDIALLPGSRLTTYLRESRDVIAVTNAVVFSKEGKKVVSSKFLDIGKEYIEIIFPAEIAS